MAKPYDSPWARTISGPWTEKVERAQKPCYYCDKPAAMKEPGTGRPAHKACAEKDTGGQPLGNWDGVEHKAVDDGPIGCGGRSDEVVSGRRCAGTGGQLTCKICPRSPTYEGPFS